MSKRWILVFALAFLVGITAFAYAETQNVKVSGDLLIRGISRSNFSLVDEETYWLDGTWFSLPKHKQSGITSTARVRVDADLTDDVSVTMRLLNERTWGREHFTQDYYGYELGYWDDSELHSGNTGVDIDLAYITLKEFLYSPLTLIVGRQELRYGNALVIGDPDTNMFAETVGVPMDLSSRKSFDAVRGILDYDPLTIDLVYAKIDENEMVWWHPYFNGYWAGGQPIVERKDLDLYGINAHYELADRNAFVEGYFFTKQDRISVYDPYGAGYPWPGGKDIIQTVGVLVGGELIENLTGSLEYARQFGRKSYILNNHFLPPLAQRGKVSAWALQANLDYVFGDMETTPSIGLAYSYLSGDDNPWSGKVRTWDPMFEDQMMNSIPNALFYNTNCTAWNLRGAMKPREDMTLSAVLGYYRLNEGLHWYNDGGIPSVYGEGYYPSFAYPSSGKKDLGWALDLGLIYDYTEDVQFGLHLGYFDPGSAFEYPDSSYNLGDYPEEASEVIGSMKVTF